jgi:hypothetical protein
MKQLVIAGCSLLWLMVSIVRIQENPRKNADIGIDASWVLALPEMLHHHSISGRDFHFTYGPLSQMLAYAGASLHSPWSGISSRPLIIFAFYSASIALLACILLLMKDVGWKECLFIYAASAGLNLFSEPTAFRPLALILCAVICYRALESRSGPGKWIGPVATGAACFAAQSLTFEIGLYSVMTVFAIALAWMALKDPIGRRQLPARLGIILIAYLTANLAIDGYFVLSSPTYSFFDYQRYSMEVVQGFSFSQPLPWALSAGVTAGLAMVALFAVGAAIIILTRVNMPGRFLMLPLLICALIALKSLMVRSDSEHITQSISPIVFLMLSTGAIFVMRWRQFKIPVILWAAAFAILWNCWPGWAGLYSIEDLHRAVTSVPPIQKMARLRKEIVRPETVLPEGFTAQNQIPTGSLLAFPYAIYIPIALQRPFVAPVPMAYNAGTELLQQFYIQRLERERDLSVIYGSDGVASTAIDGIPIITRAPHIFNYLYEHFRLGGTEHFGKGFFLLRRDSTPRHDLQRIEVDAKVRQLGNSVWEIRLDKPVACNLLSLDLEIDYPWRQYLAHPAQLELQFFRSGMPILKTGLCAIKRNAPFTTLVSLMPEDRFYEIFGEGKAATGSWDRLRISPRAPDPLGVLPSRIDIRSLACLLDYQN